MIKIKNDNIFGIKIKCEDVPFGETFTGIISGSKGLFYKANSITIVRLDCAGVVWDIYGVFNVIDYIPVELQISILPKN